MTRLLNTIFLPFVIIVLQQTNTVNSSPLDFPTSHKLNLTSFLPTPGQDTKSELGCYSLPYGALGFVSHLLTYWTLFCFYIGIKPLAPWSILEIGYKGFIWDMFISLVTFGTTLDLATTTILRCRKEKHFMLIAIWKTMFSMTLAITTIHVTISGRNAKKVCYPLFLFLFSYLSHRIVPFVVCETESSSKTYHRTEDFILATPWLVLCLGSLITGLIGLVPIVLDNWHSNPQVRLITKVMVFGLGIGSIGIFLVLCWLWVWTDDYDGISGYKSLFVSCLYSVPAAVAIFAFFAALYSDWILGAVAHNIVGTPISDVSAVYWTYWIAKRFPLFVFSWLTR